MSKPLWRLSLLLLLALPARGQEAPAADPDGQRPPARWDWFTGRREVFHPLIADPREAQIALAYYRQRGQHTADVGLGHSWGMARWTTSQGYKLQWNVEGLAYSRFKLSGAVNEFDTVDFFANLPIEFRNGRFSARAMLFHQSSHLGDDYIRRTGDAGFRYSIDGLRGHQSFDVLKGLRVYTGQTYLLHSVPNPERRMAQAGLELSTPALYPFGKAYPSFFYLAQDCQWREYMQWNMNSRTVIGWRLRSQSQPRAVRFQLGYFEGHSPYGQFFLRRERYSDVSIIFEL